MKPIYTVLIKHGDREHVMAFPFTYRRLSRALAALGYSFEPSTEDDDAYIEEYRSIYRGIPFPYRRGAGQGYGVGLCE